MARKILARNNVSILAKAPGTLVSGYCFGSDKRSWHFVAHAFKGISAPEQVIQAIESFL